MHVAFVEPCFPNNQREFLRGLLSTGARISAISERPIEALPRELREGLFQFERVRSVVDEHAMQDAVKRLSQRVQVDRLEATVEAHVMAAAHVRDGAEKSFGQDDIRDSASAAPRRRRRGYAATSRR